LRKIFASLVPLSFNIGSHTCARTHARARRWILCG